MTPAVRWTARLAGASTIANAFANSIDPQPPIAASACAFRAVDIARCGLTTGWSFQPGECNPVSPPLDPPGQATPGWQGCSAEPVPRWGMKPFIPSSTAAIKGPVVYASKREPFRRSSVAAATEVEPLVPTCDAQSVSGRTAADWIAHPQARGSDTRPRVWTTGRRGSGAMAMALWRWTQFRLPFRIDCTRAIANALFFTLHTARNC